MILKLLWISMTRLIYCDKCKKVVEFIDKTTTQGGITTIETICGNCGVKKKTSINHIHYGERDSK